MKDPILSPEPLACETCPAAGCASGPARCRAARSVPDVERRQPARARRSPTSAGANSTPIAAMRSCCSPGLSPTAHAASSAGNRDPGWWENMIGPGRAIDTDRYFVMCVNSLGSCFGSTGPASTNPATGKAYRLEFPELSVEDIARAGYEAARSLGIQQLDTVMGPSLGGMVVVAFAAMVPGGTRRARQHLRLLRRTALRHRAALRATRSHHERSGLGRRAVRRYRAWPAVGHAAGAQARHDHLSLRRGMARALCAQWPVGHGAQGRG